MAGVVVHVQERKHQLKPTLAGVAVMTEFPQKGKGAGAVMGPRCRFQDFTKGSETFVKKVQRGSSRP